MSNPSRKHHLHKMTASIIACVSLVVSGCASMTAIPAVAQDTMQKSPGLRTTQRIPSDQSVIEDRPSQAPSAKGSKQPGVEVKLTDRLLSGQRNQNRSRIPVVNAGYEQEMNVPYAQSAVPPGPQVTGPQGLYPTQPVINLPMQSVQSLPPNSTANYASSKLNQMLPDGHPLQEPIDPPNPATASAPEDQPNLSEIKPSSGEANLDSVMGEGPMMTPRNSFAMDYGRMIDGMNIQGQRFNQPPKTATEQALELVARNEQLVHEIASLRRLLTDAKTTIDEQSMKIEETEYALTQSQRQNVSLRETTAKLRVEVKHLEDQKQEIKAKADASLRKIESTLDAVLMKSLISPDVAGK